MHKSIHRFCGKIFKYKKCFSKRGITPLISKMNFDDVSVQPTYLSMGFLVLYEEKIFNGIEKTL